jgi:hypothetical protein
MAETESIAQTVNEMEFDEADDIASATAEIFSVISGRVETAQCYEDDEGRLYMTSATNGLSVESTETGVVREDGEMYRVSSTRRELDEEIDFVRIEVKDGGVHTEIISGDEINEEDLGIEEVEVFTADYLD